MIVDSENNERGYQLRRLDANEESWIRASYVFVDVYDPSNNSRKFLVQERSETKDYAPGCYMLSSGGVFNPGETKLSNALRELQEEVGISPSYFCDDRDDPSSEDFVDAGWMNYQDPINRVWASLYILRTTQARVDAQLKLQEEEVKSVEYWTKDEINERIRNQTKDEVSLLSDPNPGEIARCSLAAFEHLDSHNYF